MLPYTYKIKSVNIDNKTMEVEFSSPGKSTVVVWTALPLQNTSIDDFLQMYAPFGYWENEGVEYYIPELGKTGVFTPPNPTDIQQQIDTATEANRLIKSAELKAVVQEVLTEINEGTI